jgi:hypothetical protein
MDNIANTDNIYQFSLEQFNDLCSGVRTISKASAENRTQHFPAGVQIRNNDCGQIRELHKPIAL